MFEELFQRVKDYLSSQNWKYNIEDNLIQLSFSLENQLEECEMRIGFVVHNDDSLSVHTRTICPLPVSADDKDHAIEFITRANYNMIDGYFSYLFPEKCTDEGMIVYNSWLYCNSIIPSLNDIESSVDCPLTIMTTYGDALFNVIKHNADPEEEIQRVEG